MRLKLFVFTIISLFILSSSISSQIKVSLGLQGGLNFASVSSTFTNLSGRTGMTFGTFLDVSFMKYLAVETGLNYTMKGFSFTDQNTNNQGTVKLNYFEIPILVKGQFPVEKFTPFIMFGPLLGMQLSATEDVTGGQQGTDVSTNFGGLDFGLLIAGGGAFKVIPTLSIFTAFGYNIGLSNVYKDPNNANTTSSVKNTGFRITAGAMFHF